MKILSIDFDIIMAPSIDLYNDKVPQNSWKELEKNPQLALCQMDSIHYKRLTDLIMILTNNIDKNKIFFIENHAQAYNILKNFNNIDLINIDHHHDIAYPRVQAEKLTCANWVQKLYDKGILNSYLWIKNDSSYDCDIDIDFKYHSNLLREYDLAQLEDIEMIILCLSEPWVPIKFRELFVLWRDLLTIKYEHNFIIDYTIPDENLNKE